MESIVGWVFGVRCAIDSICWRIFLFSIFYFFQIINKLFYSFVLKYHNSWACVNAARRRRYKIHCGVCGQINNRFVWGIIWLAFHMQHSNTIWHIDFLNGNSWRDLHSTYFVQWFFIRVLVVVVTNDMFPGYFEAIPKAVWKMLPVYWLLNGSKCVTEIIRIGQLAYFLMVLVGFGYIWMQALRFYESKLEHCCCILTGSPAND